MRMLPHSASSFWSTKNSSSPCRKRLSLAFASPTRSRKCGPAQLPAIGVMRMADLMFYSLRYSAKTFKAELDTSNMLPPVDNEIYSSFLIGK